MREEIEAFKKAREFSREITKACIDKKMTLLEFRMLKTALPMEIDETISKYMQETKL